MKQLLIPVIFFMACVSCLKDHRYNVGTLKAAETDGFRKADGADTMLTVPQNTIRRIWRRRLHLSKW